MQKSIFGDINNVIKEIELTELQKGNIYPVTIVADRYSGCYSGAKWLAFQLDTEEIPAEIGSDDADEENFWREHKNEDMPIGKGSSPNEALEDLKIKAKEFYSKW